MQGVKRADGDGKVKCQRGNRILTCSPLFRDQLIQLLLHAGYAAYWTHGHAKGVGKGYAEREAGDERVYREDEIDDFSEFRVLKATCQRQQFVVSWMMDRQAKGQQCVTPTLRKDDIQAEAYSGRLWCVQVAHSDHLIVAQRAVVDRQGDVLRASLPVVIGNCWAYETGLALDARMTDELPYNSYEHMHTHTHTHRHLTAHLHPSTQLPPHASSHPAPLLSMCCAPCVLVSYYDYYGPDFNLHIQPSNMENQNTPKYLERTQSMLLDVLRQLPAAPSVQYSTPIPREREDVDMSREEAEEEVKEQESMDHRETVRELDRRREDEREFFAEEKDNDSREVRNSSSSSAGATASQAPQA